MDTRIDSMFSSHDYGCLLKGGIDSWEKLLAVKHLRNLEGVGPVTERRILARVREIQLFKSRAAELGQFARKFELFASLGSADGCKNVMDQISNRIQQWRTADKGE